MELSPSAHTDTFCRDNLPPASQWPELRFDLAGLSYPDRLNCAEALLDDVVARFGPDRPCLRTPTEMWTYGDLLRRANQAAQVLVEDFGLVPGNRVLLRGLVGPAQQVAVGPHLGGGAQARTVRAEPGDDVVQQRLGAVEPVWIAQPGEVEAQLRPLARGREVVPAKRIGVRGGRQLHRRHPLRAARVTGSTSIHSS